MSELLIVLIVVVSILLIVSILLQHQGTGLGGTFGGEGNFYRSRRGVEKALFSFTIILATLFTILCILKIVFI